MRLAPAGISSKASARTAYGRSVSLIHSEEGYGVRDPFAD